MSEDIHPGIIIKPSDLYYRYKRKKDHRDEAKFTGKPDEGTFDRDDMYDVIAMLEVVMNNLGSREALVLEKVEEMMVKELPTFVTKREDVFDCLYMTMKDLLNKMEPSNTGVDS